MHHWDSLSGKFQNERPAKEVWLTGAVSAAELRERVAEVCAGEVECLELAEVLN